MAQNKFHKHFKNPLRISLISDKKKTLVLAYKNNISCVPSSCSERFCLGNTTPGVRGSGFKYCKQSVTVFFQEQLLYCLLPHLQKMPVTVTGRSGEYKESHYFNFFFSEKDHFTAGFSLVQRGKEILRKDFSCFGFPPKLQLKWKSNNTGA